VTASKPPRGIADADIAIVGAGVMGLALAYNLARTPKATGAKRIVVVDGHYLAWGASGRNGGGVRQQWSTEMNVRLMQESMDICAHFAKQMRINVWMRRGGYLFLARTQAAARRLERNVAVQARCGLGTEMISPEEARALVPELAIERTLAACYNPTDGIVFPWPFLWGYAHAAAKRGVAIHTSTPVTAIERRGRGGFRIQTPAGAFTAERVVCAAGAWSPEVARLVGASLPNRPQRHEILSTEPLKPFLKPMVTVSETGLYVSQSLRGELVGGITLPPGHEQADQAEDDGEVRLGSRLAFTTAMARALVELMPILGHVKVVRQWAGPYDVSPDGDPIVGELPDVPGFHVVCGFRGHGFMMAPVVARHFAAYLQGGAAHEFLSAWTPARFATGAPPRAGGENMFIG
jgi:sarcosine oxidase subunit beta